MINYDKLYEELEPDELFLKKTTKLDEFKNEEIKQHLEPLYKAGFNETMKHRLGTIMNSIFTQENQTFLMSRDSTALLFEGDLDSKYKSCSNSDYKHLLKTITNISLFETLRIPVGRKAGVYKLVAPELVDTLYRLVGRKALEEQERKALEYYDGTDKPKKEPRSFKQYLKDNNNGK